MLKRIAYIILVMILMLVIRNDWDNSLLLKQTIFVDLNAARDHFKQLKIDR